eukprot:scaffold14535_cov127-Isochrysis_galbana.AAC.1
MLALQRLHKLPLDGRTSWCVRGCASYGWLFLHVWPPIQFFRLVLCVSCDLDLCAYVHFVIVCLAAAAPTPRFKRECAPFFVYLQIIYLLLCSPTTPNVPRTETMPLGVRPCRS